MSQLRTWLEQHKVNRHTLMLIDRWNKAIDEPEEALMIEERFDEWLTHRSGPSPDLVACIARYGHTRLLLQDWKLPIEVPEDEYDQWRAETYHMTLTDFQERLAGVAGGFLELTGRNPQLSLQILQDQLAEKLMELDQLVNLPLDRYTPQFTEEALTARYAAQGFEGRTLELAVAEHLDDSDDMSEQAVLDRPFARRQELECFEWGMEKIRLFALSEQMPELRLPNPELHAALMQIDLNDLLRRLNEVDQKLSGIWRYLAKRNYYLNVPYEPEVFWWRHWKQPGRGARQPW